MIDLKAIEASIEAHKVAIEMEITNWIASERQRITTEIRAEVTKSLDTYKKSRIASIIGAVLKEVDPSTANPTKE